MRSELIHTQDPQGFEMWYWRDHFFPPADVADAQVFAFWSLMCWPHRGPRAEA